MQIHATLVLPAPLAPPTLLPQLVDLLRFYLSFPIHDHTGDPLSEDEVTAAHYERVQQLQQRTCPVTKRSLAELTAFRLPNQSNRLAVQFDPFSRPQVRPRPAFVSLHFLLLPIAIARRLCLLHFFTPFSLLPLYL